MTYAWEALAARAKGMTSHLLPEERLRRVERVSGFAELARELGESAYGALLPPPRDAGPVALERAITRSSAARMTTLSRWAGPAGGALAPLFLEQDARNIRILLRGLAGAWGQESRLAGAIPTPSLDRRSLEHLARAESAGAVAGTLTAWGHPLGSALLHEAGEAHTDLFRLETALDRGFARAASEAARRGGRHMRSFVAESLDVRNVLAALVLAGARREDDVVDLFVEGGTRLSREDFQRAVSTQDPRLAADVLRAASSGAPFAGAMAERPLGTAAVASQILAARIERLRQVSRMDPVSALPVLLFVLRLRRETTRIRRALWSAALAEGVGA